VESDCRKLLHMPIAAQLENSSPVMEPEGSSLWLQGPQEVTSHFKIKGNVHKNQVNHLTGKGQESTEPNSAGSTKSYFMVLGYVLFWQHTDLFPHQTDGHGVN
jgi:hypothetical protein